MVIIFVIILAHKQFNLFSKRNCVAVSSINLVDTPLKIVFNLYATIIALY